MHVPFVRFVPLILLAMLLAACGGTPAVPTTTPVPTVAPEPTPEPTAEPTPEPTAEPTPEPTAESEPTTESDADADDAATSDSNIQAAIERSREIETYRLELTMAGQGLGEDVLPGAEPGQQVELFSIDGAFDGSNSDLVLGGLLASFLGVADGLEVRTVDDVSYLRGPVPLLGASEDRWYELPADQSGVAEPPLAADDLLGSFGGESFDESGFTQSGSEEVDGLQCEVYSGDREATLAALEGLGDDTLPGGEDENLEVAELRFWVCEDGYVHQIQANLSGTNPEAPDQQVELDLLMRFFDINGDISIEAPDDAAPLEVPGS
jgi:hypothetical protein